MSPVLSLPTLDDLCAYIHQVLCPKTALDPVQSPLRHQVIQRRGRTCGLFVEVARPRLLRSYSVWAGEETRVLFYDNSGVRFAELRLSEAPDPLHLAG